ncbi:pimeloyl-ACP methyl ester carboxylesterase [Aquimarina sp. MAR_2010_214]|uniref:alpha/beta fold hydrolase n=1 Tax=Aquimarina sp. MAR_2010_214 TaxID=1250026 RepID=UPI000C7049DA|nr:alpha/beta hydrolase [Aquimarina sp. MAR_2010_214]PKV52782.1 pimeloyl-ACP methyl ester carboxylesterase [Aquimarina sp. MAR_2010_214]
MEICIKKSTFLYSIKRVITPILIVTLVLTSCKQNSSNKTNVEVETIKSDSISEQKYVIIEGIEQFILVSGQSKSNPLLLILHGGPGTSEMPMFRKYNSELEKHFLVVHWDQRSAGKSFSKEIPNSTINVPQMIEDAHQLTRYLKKKFKKEKIFLLGHSWGSFLGINTVFKYPEDYYAYIGTGQIANQLISEQLGYEFVLQKAKEANDIESIDDLNKLGQLTIDDKTPEEIMSWIFKQRGYLGKYGGAMFEMDGAKMMMSAFAESKDLTDYDKEHFMDGSMLSLYKLFPTVLKTDLTTKITELKVPTYFLQGIADYTTSYSEAKKYFGQLKVPQKEFIDFNKSGHNPPFEESEKFNKIMINKVLKHADKK